MFLFFLSSFYEASAANLNAEKEFEEMWYRIEEHTKDGDHKKALELLVEIESYLYRVDLPGNQKSQLMSRVYLFEIDIDLFESTLEKDDYILSKVYEYSGIKSLMMGDAEASKVKLTKALEISRLHKKAFRVYRWLGLIAIQQEDITESIKLLNQSIASAEAYFDKDSDVGNGFLVSIHSLLVSTNTNRGDVRSALKHATKGLECARKTGKDYFIANALLTKITGIVEYKDPKVLRSMLQELDKKIEAVDNNGKSQYHNLLGTVLLRDGQYDKAITNFKKAYNYSDVISNQKLNQQKIGECLQMNGEYQNAIKYYDELIDYYNDQAKSSSTLAELYFTKSKSLRALGRLEEAKYNLQLAIDIKGEFEHWKINHLSLLAPIYVDYYKETNHRIYLDSALLAIAKTDSLILHLRNERRYFEDQINLGQRIYKTYASNLKVLSNIYKIDDKKVNKEHLFKYMEGLKSYSLKELLKTDDAVIIGAIPETALRKEKVFQHQLSNLKNRIYKIETQNPDSFLIEKLNIELDSIKDIYYDFLKTIEQNYPEYYKHQYDEEIISLKYLQEILSYNEMIIEYFLAEDNMYILMIQKSEVRFTRKKIPVGLRYNISRFKTILESPNSKLDEFKTHSYEIFKIILKDELEEIGPNIDRLSIVPDDILNVIPFETLVYSQPTGINKTFKNLDYLCNRYTISYGHSSTFLAQVANKKSHRNPIKYSGFAPAYQNKVSNMVKELSQNTTRGSYQDLTFARKSITDVSELFRGKAYLKEDATVANFLYSAPKSDIIHLAMHGEVDLMNPTSSRLIFHGDDQQSSLYVNDIYGLYLPAELAVLGACNTGVGELINGDGIQNMSRAFHFAGVKNTIMSLWSVPDIQTATIISSFFEKIKDGYPIDHALRDTKLEYLKESNELRAHPYYWAGLVSSGSMNPILTNTSNPFGWIKILTLIFFLIIATYIAISWHHKNKSKL